MGYSINDIKKCLLRLYGIWVLADFILLGLSLLYVSVTGNLADLLSLLLTNWAFGFIPFPFDILVAWQIDPLSIILQMFIFLLILAFQYLFF